MLVQPKNLPLEIHTVKKILKGLHEWSPPILIFEDGTHLHYKGERPLMLGDLCVGGEVYRDMEELLYYYYEVTE